MVRPIDRDVLYLYRPIIIVLSMCSTSWQDRAVFFEMLWLPSGTLRRGPSDSDSWNSLLPLMAVKINIRMPANRETRCARRNSRWLFRQGVRQTRKETVDKQKGNSFDAWLRQKQIALRPLLCWVCCDAYTHFKTTYKAAHEGETCFGVRRFEFEQWGPSRGSAQWIFLRDKELWSHSPHTHTHTQTYKSP